MGRPSAALKNQVGEGVVDLEQARPHAAADAEHLLDKLQLGSEAGENRAYWRRSGLACCCCSGHEP